VGDDGTLIADFMLGVLTDEKEKTADRMEAAKWLGDRGFGGAVQALDIDVYPHSFDISYLSTTDLEAMAAILSKYSPEVAEQAESGELRLGAGSASIAASR
jgi:hypothetical protein